MARSTAPANRMPALTVVLLAAVALTVVWSYIVMHMGRFAPGSDVGWASATSMALYAGYAVVALAMIAVPHQFARLTHSPQPVVAVALLMVLSATVESFSYGQTLFDPALIGVAGALMASVSYGMAICVVYPLVFHLLDPLRAGAVVIVAHLLKRLASPALDMLGMGVNTLLLAYGIPMVVAALVIWAMRTGGVEGRAGGADGVGTVGTVGGLGRTGDAGDAGRTDDAGGSGGVLSVYAVLATAAIAMAACDLSDASGIWSTAQGSASVSPAMMAGEIALVAALALLLIPFRNASLAVRFAPMLLLAVSPALVGAVLGTGVDSVGEGLEGALVAFAVGVSTFYHGAAWVVTFSCARAGAGIHRSIGVILLVESLVSAVLMGIGQALPQASFVLVPLLPLVVATLCAWIPVAPALALGTGRGAQSRNASVQERTSATSPAGSPDASGLANDLSRALRVRCREVATSHGLSEREHDVLVLLVEGWSRQSICDSLGISEGTVKTHASHIYGKLGVQGRQDLAGIVFSPATSEAACLAGATGAVGGDSPSPVSRSNDVG